MHFLRRNWLFVPYITVVLFPTVVVLLVYPDWWFDWRYSGAQLLGLTGSVLLLLQLVLAARWKWLDQQLGLDRISRIHKWSGIVGYCFIGLHAIGIIGYYFQFGLNTFILFIQPGWRWETLGMAAFDLMTVVIIITLLYHRWRIPYHWWKRLHYLMYAAVFAGLLHSLFLGTHLTSGILRWYWICLILVATIALVYRRVIVPWLAPRYTVTQHDLIANRVHHITFEPTNGSKMNHSAGQFAFVQLHTTGVTKEWHPFTISSAPSSEHITMSIKESGDWTSTLSSVTTGTVAKLEGPYGQFSYTSLPSNDLSYVFIAGGIGITPLHAMITELLANGSQRPLLLLYAARTAQDFAFKAEFDRLAASHSNFTVHYVDSTMDQAFLSNAVPEPGQRHYFICGPKPMMRSIRRALAILGVTSANIHSEEFALH